MAAVRSATKPPRKRVSSFTTRRFATRDHPRAAGGGMAARRVGNVGADAPHLAERLASRITSTGSFSCDKRPSTRAAECARSSRHRARQSLRRSRRASDQENSRAGLIDTSRKGRRSTRSSIFSSMRPSRARSTPRRQLWRSFRRRALSGGRPQCCDPQPIVTWLSSRPRSGAAEGERGALVLRW